MKIYIGFGDIAMGVSSDQESGAPCLVLRNGVNKRTMAMGGDYIPEDGDISIVALSASGASVLAAMVTKLEQAALAQFSQLPSINGGIHE